MGCCSLVPPHLVGPGAVGWGCSPLPRLGKGAKLGGHGDLAGGTCLWALATRGQHHSPVRTWSNWDGLVPGSVLQLSALAGFIPCRELQALLLQASSGPQGGTKPHIPSSGRGEEDCEICWLPGGGQSGSPGAIPGLAAEGALGLGHSPVLWLLLATWLWMGRETGHPLCLCSGFGSQCLET